VSATKSTRTEGLSDSTLVNVPLRRLVDGWVAEGLISEAQGVRILEREGLAAVPVSEAAPRRASSLAAEALAYLGGVVILVGALSLGAMYWDSLTVPVRLVLVGGAAALLYVAGVLLARRAGSSALRMRAVSWLMATGAVAGFLALLGADALGWQEDHVLLLTAAGTALSAGVLWYQSRSVLQQAAFFVALMGTAAFFVGDVTDRSSLPGVAAWGVAVVWFLLGWGGVVAPRRPVLALAGIAAIVTAMTTFPVDAGIALALATASGLVALAVAFRDLALMAVGALGLLQVLPMALGEWFPDTVTAPLVLLGGGVVLLLLAVRMSLRDRTAPLAPERPWTSGSRSAAIGASVVVVLAVTATLAVIAVG
jgi:hypothetical protein